MKPNIPPPRSIAEHPYVQRAQSVSQHAASILSDLLKSDIDDATAENLVNVAFTIAQTFDDRVEVMMKEAVERVKSEATKIIEAP